MFVQNNSYVQQALARLLTQYRNSPNLQAVLTSLIQQIQLLEDAITEVNTLSYLPNAFGAQLDVIGQIVGISRPAGMPDAQYQLLIYEQIKINSSQGQPEQAIQFFLIFTQLTQVRMYEFFPGDVLMESSYDPPDQATLNSLISGLDNVLPAGVRSSGIVVYDPDIPFTYSPITIAPYTGYGSVSASGGGKYGKLLRPFNGPWGYGTDGDMTVNPLLRGYGTRLDPIIGGAYQG